jgi:quercetin dioxygenase-like cupin family protein
MDAFSLPALIAAQVQSGAQWHEFFRVPALSLGLYVLAAGEDDPQSPHTEDEIYYVAEGKAHLQVDGEDRAVGPGDVLFVAAHAVHRFHSITEDLKLLVFFAPAETA